MKVNNLEKSPSKVVGGQVVDFLECQDSEMCSNYRRCYAPLLISACDIVCHAAFGIIRISGCALGATVHELIHEVSQLVNPTS